MAITLASVSATRALAARVLILWTWFTLAPVVGSPCELFKLSLVQRAWILFQHAKLFAVPCCHVVQLLVNTTRKLRGNVTTIDCATGVKGNATVETVDHVTAKLLSVSSSYKFN